MLMRTDEQCFLDEQCFFFCLTEGTLNWMEGLLAAVSFMHQSWLGWGSIERQLQRGSNRNRVEAKLVGDTAGSGRPRPWVAGIQSLGLAFGRLLAALCFVS